MNQPPVILVVDDEADFREIFSRNLRSAGFNVYTAEDGFKCLEKAKKYKPDLILLDMKMPGMNGAGAIMKLKEDPELRNVKVVFLSNFGEATAEMQKSDRHFAQDIGASGYIKKTENLDDIVERVKSFLR